MVCAGFTPEAKEWLNSKPYVKFGKVLLGSGGVGDVYQVDNFPELCIKVPRKFLSLSSVPGMPDLDSSTLRSRLLIKSGLEHYNELKDLSVLVPMVSIDLGIKPAYGDPYTGIVMPILDTSRNTLVNVSDAQLMDLKERLGALSEAGFRVRRCLPVGMSQEGRLVLYDTGRESLIKCTPDENAYKINTRYLGLFLYSIGKKLSYLGNIVPKQKQEA